jgi:predicted dehydrogenase
VVGANESVRIAVVGLRSKGSDHVRDFRCVPGVKVVAVCDVDTDILALERFKFEKGGESVRTFREYRAGLGVGSLSPPEIED